jgi:hypothetical protein
MMEARTSQQLAVARLEAVLAQGERKLATIFYLERSAGVDDGAATFKKNRPSGRSERRQAEVGPPSHQTM